MKVTRDFYVPIGAEKQEYPEIPAVAYRRAFPDGRFQAVCFGGKRTKPDIHALYRSEVQQEKAIQEWLDRLQRRKEYKAAQKAIRKAKGSGLMEPAHSAKILKGLLRQFFPGVKFSVKSEIFSMGNAIRINYSDGPLLEEVRAIAKLFEYGRFDAMQDLAYSVDINVPNCRGAKFVSVHREISPKLKAALFPILKDRYAPRWGNGENIECFALYQLEEAERFYKLVPRYELDRRIQERTEVVTAMAVLAAG